MKTILLTLALAVSTLTGWTQGIIAIANDSGRLFEVAGYGPIPNGPLPTGHVIVLSLYAGTSAGSLSLQTSYALTGLNWLAPGRGATKPITLTGVPGGVPQFFNVVLTDNDALRQNSIDGTLVGGTQIPGAGIGPSFFPGVTYFGSSGLFQFRPGGPPIPITPPLINGTGTTWPLGSIYIGIPEPSSMALFGMGVGLAMLFRRRNQIAHSHQS